MIGRTAKGKYLYYDVAQVKGKERPKRRTRMIRAEELEGLVIDRIRLLAENADLLGQAEEDARKNRSKRTAKKGAEIKALEAELTEVRSQKQLNETASR